MFCWAGSPTSRRGLMVNTRIRCPSCATVLPCMAKSCLVTRQTNVRGASDLMLLWSSMRPVSIYCNTTLHSMYLGHSDQIIACVIAARLGMFAPGLHNGGLVLLAQPLQTDSQCLCIRPLSRTHCELTPTSNTYAFAVHSTTFMIVQAAFQVQQVQQVKLQALSAPL
jgi:hypothetical protein